jgi:hypothetical protein
VIKKGEVEFHHSFNMQDVFEEVRRQIHEIRNMVGPVHLKMADLELRVVEARNSFDERFLTLESKLLGALFRLDKHEAAISEIRERFKK